MFVSVDRSNRSLSLPPSIGVRVLRRGPGEVSGVRKKSAQQKSRLRRETPGLMGTYSRSGPYTRALETWIDVTFFRPARARRAGGPARRQTFRAGARLPLGQCGLLCRAAHERDADLQREPAFDLGADDQFREAFLLSLGAPRR